VSFIPNFTFNLLSVSALLTNSAYYVCFYSNQFVIQEMSYCKKIGTGDLIHGLYVLNLKDTHSTCNVSDHNSCINVVSSTCTQAINWHNRFSHESDSVLKILSNKIPFALPNEFSTKSCYVCPIAKFRRLSFPSINHVNFTFNLLSVSALLTNSAYSVCFYSNQFVIQEMSYCKKISRGDLIHGLCFEPQGYTFHLQCF